MKCENLTWNCGAGELTSLHVDILLTESLFHDSHLFTPIHYVLLYLTGDLTYTSHFRKTYYPLQHCSEFRN